MNRTRLPLSFPLTQHVDEDDLVRIFHLAHALTNGEQHAERLHVRAPVPLADLLPAGGEVLATSRNGSVEHVAVAFPGCSLRVDAWPNGATVAITAQTAARLQEAVADVRSRIPVVEEPNTRPVSFWNASASCGPQVNHRRLEVPTWAEVADNYARSTREALDPLLLGGPPDQGSGRLVLWFGEPGTGKTNALRALIREWSGWCSASYVADPEKLFEDTSYLLDVVSSWNPSDAGSDDAEGDPANRWRLLIAEDTDEYLRSSARQQAGAALGRLLNLSDGLLGQGTKTLVLITTNEELSRLHPAIVRPGRCWATVAFERLDPDECAAWLDDGTRPPAPMTLAELYAQRAGHAQGSMSPLTTGAYL